MSSQIAAILALLILGTPPLGGCAWLDPDTVPYTGRKRPHLLYTEQEMAILGAQSYAEVLKKFKVVRGTPAAAQVQRVGQRIAAATGKNWDWEYHLLEAPDNVNAFCLPGGKIAVFTGLLPFIRSDADMAIVLGHETAHAVLEHQNERMSQPLAERLVGMPTSIAVDTWGAISPETRKVVMNGFGLGHVVGEVMPYSQQQETEADDVGLIFMKRAGYPLAGAPAFWKRMEKGDKGRITDSLSTHPSSAARAKNIEEQIRKLENQ
jgi:predicted Zn-dependent protease